MERFTLICREQTKNSITLDAIQDYFSDGHVEIHKEFAVVRNYIPNTAPSMEVLKRGTRCPRTNRLIWDEENMEFLYKLSALVAPTEGAYQEIVQIEGENQSIFEVDDMFRYCGIHFGEPILLQVRRGVLEQPCPTLVRESLIHPSVETYELRDGDLFFCEGHKTSSLGELSHVFRLALTEEYTLRQSIDLVMIQTELSFCGNYAYAQEMSEMSERNARIRDAGLW